MLQLDYAVFMVAGIVGALGFKWGWSQNVAWAIVGLWALLKLLKVL